MPYAQVVYYNSWLLNDLLTETTRLWQSYLGKGLDAGHAIADELFRGAKATGLLIDCKK